MVARNPEMKKHVLQATQQTFSRVACISLPEDVNEIVIAFQNDPIVDTPTAVSPLESNAALRLGNEDNTNSNSFPNLDKEVGIDELEAAQLSCKLEDIGFQDCSKPEPIMNQGCSVSAHHLLCDSVVL